jgi:hypothetical protein
MNPTLKRTIRPILMRNLRLRFQKTTVGKTARKKSVAELKAANQLVCVSSTCPKISRNVLLE